MGSMNKTVIAWLTLLLTLAWAASGLAASGLAASAPRTATGEVKMLSLKAKTLSLQVSDTQNIFFNLSDSTVFKKAKDLREIAVGDRISIDYTTDKDVNAAVTITKMIAEMPPGVGTITTAELEALVDQGPEKAKYVLIDARSAAKFTNGHIRTAVSAPYADLAKNPSKFLPADKNKTIIFYCEGITCDMSGKSAQIAVNSGYNKVLVYPEGEFGWKKTEYCIATSLEYLQHGNIVLVDLRDPEAVKKGHIPRAVNIPLAKLEDAEDMFPEYKGASIIFYGGTAEDLRTAVSIVRDWDFKNVSAFPGGIDEWQAKGLKLEKGATATRITYVKKLSPHEMGAEEFKKIVGAGTYYIVDVRTKEEFAKGHINNAVNVPLEELLSRASEIPKNKPTLVHCTTGARAEMAYEILKDKGLNLRYLNATIEFGKDNKYVITE